MLSLLSKTVVILVVLGTYNGWLLGQMDPLSKRIVTRLRLAKRHPFRMINDVVTLALVGIAQFACFILLLIVTHVHLRALVAFDPVLIVYGLLLGIAEMALASFLSSIALRAAMLLFPSHGPTEIDDWLTLAKGGWMRYFLSTIKIAPFPLVVLLTGFYIFVEEMIFRGVVITYFVPLGAPIALVMSVLFFVCAQTLRMPSWRTAMFPVIGALVLGTLHGLLFLAVPNVLPLMVAHYVFFIAAVC